MEGLPTELLVKNLCCHLPYTDVRALSEVSSSLTRIKPEFTLWTKSFMMGADRRSFNIHIKKIPEDIFLELPGNKEDVSFEKEDIKRA